MRETDEAPSPPLPSPAPSPQCTCNQCCLLLFLQKHVSAQRGQQRRRKVVGRNDFFFLSVMLSWAALSVASYADILWDRRAIFFLHERLLKLREHSGPFVCSSPNQGYRLPGYHVTVTSEPIGAGLLCDVKLIINWTDSPNAFKIKRYSIQSSSRSQICEHFILFTAKYTIAPRGHLNRLS